ncbi:apoptosis-associated speck-like protein containing a CARD [Hemicordylus capensis]|uniref:apoptosis-associated speck-like protein containing a CARD n=1 Tax=Hemicordylus capensis TaxID=884348 RepID=UPI0023047B16|nr:apoptosis-associated speck-like protein containing a CARD [Hemicordylus capensis]
MGKTVHDHLEDVLDDLTEEELRRFKSRLNRTSVRQGYENIPRGRLEKAGVLELTDLLISFYTEDYSVEVTVQVLDEVNCKAEAKKLLALTGKGAAVQTPVPATNAASGRNGGQPHILPEEHFIDRHREELIQRVSMVESVLDILYGASILNDEGYQKISSKRTSYEKMRELYSLVPSWDRSCKDKLYEALKAKSPFLIRDIEGR